MPVSGWGGPGKGWPEVPLWQGSDRVLCSWYQPGLTSQGVLCQPTLFTQATSQAALSPQISAELEWAPLSLAGPQAERTASSGEDLWSSPQPVSVASSQCSAPWIHPAPSQSPLLASAAWPHSSRSSLIAAISTTMR